MAETIGLTTPVTRTAGTTIDIDHFLIHRREQSIEVRWVVLDNTSAVIGAGSWAYTTPAQLGGPARTGAALLSLLNTRNFTTNSLLKQIMTLLQTDGLIAAGTVTGTPD